MASDLSTFSDFAPYSGSDQVMVGNGSGLPITHIGTSPLTKDLILQRVLHVPGLIKNLLSISQLTQDHVCFVIFTSSGFMIKDRRLGHILLQGPHRGGLYQYSPHWSPECSLSQHISGITWHCRLGHPAFPTLRQLLGAHGLTTSPVPILAN